MANDSIYIKYENDLSSFITDFRLVLDGTEVCSFSGRAVNTPYSFGDIYTVVLVSPSKSTLEFVGQSGDSGETREFYAFKSNTGAIIEIRKQGNGSYSDVLYSIYAVYTSGESFRLEVKHNNDLLASFQNYKFYKTSESTNQLFGWIGGCLYDNDTYNTLYRSSYIIKVNNQDTYGDYVSVYDGNPRVISLWRRTGGIDYAVTAEIAWTCTGSPAFTPTGQVFEITGVCSYIISASFDGDIVAVLDFSLVEPQNYYVKLDDAILYGNSGSVTYDGGAHIAQIVDSGGNVINSGTHTIMWETSNNMNVVDSESMTNAGTYSWDIVVIQNSNDSEYDFSASVTILPRPVTITIL